MAQSIKFLPPGYVWVYKAGNGFKGRHAYNPLTGDAISVRQAQNIQREQRQRAGTPKPPTVHRQGKLTSRAVTEYNVKGEIKNIADIHGSVRRFYFRDLYSAKQFVQEGGLKAYQQFLIQARYEEAFITGASNYTQKNGWINLTGYMDTMQQDATFWTYAQNNMSKVYLGKKGRIMLYATEY